jgi:IclR family transcriptional regulator, acetate operon repressor
VPSGSLVDRVFDVMELLADYPKGLPISDIARRLKMAKSEAHRLLGLFIKRGFASQDEFSQRYRLSIRAAAIGFRFFGKAKLEDLCQPILDRLAARAGEFARLAFVDARDLVFVAHAQGASSGLRYNAELGRLVTALHATANGRAWLATLAEAEAVELAKSRGFILPPDYVRSIVVDEGTLLEELARTRQRGYGLSIEEMDAGIATIAVAIRDRATGVAVGTVSVSGPIFRMTESRILEIAPDVRATAIGLAEVWPLSGDEPEHALARRRV